MAEPRRTTIHPRARFAVMMCMPAFLVAALLSAAKAQEGSSAEPPAATSATPDAQRRPVAGQFGRRIRPRPAFLVLPADS